MWWFFRKKKRPDVMVFVALERISLGDCQVWVKADGHENDIAVALLLAMDLDHDFAKVVRQAVTLYLDPERDVTKFND